MIITGRRIRNVTRHFEGIPEGQSIVLGVTDLNRFSDLINKLGLRGHYEDGTTVLPSSSFGPVSRYNSDGRYIIHRDQEKETAYRQVDWHWMQWSGRDDTVEKSKIIDVPYLRYPRTFVPPPSVELTISSDQQGNRLLITPAIVFTPANYERIQHVVNLFLELFRECRVLGDQVNGVPVPKVRRISWRVLPPGRRPWAQLSEELRPIIERQPGGNQPVIKHRLQAVNSYNPDFLAVGEGGFNGYVIFGFPGRDMFILECIRHGNATYVFGNDWETLSQMTKAEILSDKLQRERLIHREGWAQQLKGLFE